MASIINASTSNGIVQTADGSGILKCQANGVTTNALAWVNFGYVASAITVRSSYNVSSVTRASTGTYTINYTNNTTDANYAVVGTTQGGAINSGSGARALVPLTLTTSSVQVINTAGVGSAEDSTLVCTAIFGN